MAKLKARYVCQACGSVHSRWQGQCPDCAEWNTLIQESAAPTVFSQKHDLSTGGRAVELVGLDAEVALPVRISTGIAEFDRAVGGGRIVGEACHFIDLARHLVGSPITGFDAVAMGPASGERVTDDKATITLRFADGSLATILYLANGHKSFPKERVEVFSGGRILQLDNFRRLTGYGYPGFTGMRLWRQDKGQNACAAAFVRAMEQGKPSPIALEELLEVAKVTIELARFSDTWTTAN